MRAVAEIIEPALSPQSVTILGATGSIGKSTLDVVAGSGGKFRIEALTAMENVSALAALARLYRPRFVAIGNPAHFAALKDALAGTGIRAGAGAEALVEAAMQPAGTVVSAIVGVAGLASTMAAAKRGARIALANKECLVAAGTLLTQAAKAGGAKLIPVDSEHNALFQVFDAARPESVRQVTLTASGGPFRTWSLEQMRSATPEMAVKHPNWAMGAKISVDSATMMNKGLELIEAFHLFPLKAEQIEVLVHPESIVHGLVEYVDGSVLAQLSNPDMRTPIACALAWPERLQAAVKRLNLAELKTLTFEAPDVQRFSALALARRALAEGVTVALNAANEAAVEAFLAGRIGFLDIAKTVEATLAKVENAEPSTLEEVFEADAQARAIAQSLLKRVAA